MKSGFQSRHHPNPSFSATSTHAIGLGVVGLGRAFTLMLPTFQADSRIELVAACDPFVPAQDRFRQDFSAPVYDHVADLCADPRVEAVYIASPHQLHAEHIALAARAGKAVLVEKPMAIDMQQCTDIVNIVYETGIALIVGHSHSFNGPVLHAARLLQAGEFGHVRMLTALNYTDFLYRPRRPEELDTAQGGGVVFSQGAHQIDITRLLLGGKATRVRAQTGSWDAQRPTEGAYSALLDFEGDTFATMIYNGYAHYDSDELMEGIGEMGTPKSVGVHSHTRTRLAHTLEAEEARLKTCRNYGGTNYQPQALTPPTHHQHFGYILVSAEQADLRLTPDGLMIYTGDRRRFLPTPLGTIPRVEVVDELWACVREGQEPVHSARWARATVEVCLAILSSAASGRETRLNHQVAAHVPPQA